VPVFHVPGFAACLLSALIPSTGHLYQPIRRTIQVGIPI
jgi:hypothetical protein